MRNIEISDIVRIVLSHFGDYHDPEHRDSIRNIVEDLAEDVGLPRYYYAQEIETARAAAQIGYDV